MTQAHRRILLAEDNKVNQMVARSLLEKRGHSVRVADNGREAVLAVQKQAFDLVLMDIEMPVLDGISATELIRKLPDGRAVPIIALTADATMEQRRRCAKAGMDGFLSKPFQPAALFEVVDRLGTLEHEDVAPPSASEPAVRIERFRELMREAGVEEIVEDTLRVYRSESPGRVARIRDAVDRADARSVEAEAHALKSASLNIWAVDLAEYLDQAENAAVAGEIERARALLEPITTEFGQVMSCLDRELGERS